MFDRKLIIGISLYFLFLGLISLKLSLRFDTNKGVNDIVYCIIIFGFIGRRKFV